MNILLLFGAVLGLSSIMMGAYIDHGLSVVLDQHAVSSLKTAMHYQLLHAVLLVSLAMNALSSIDLSQRRIFKSAAIAIIIGSVMFSAGIFVAALAKHSLLIFLAPAGGLMLMFGWLLLGICAMKSRC